MSMIAQADLEICPRHPKGGSIDGMEPLNHAGIRDPTNQLQSSLQNNQHGTGQNDETGGNPISSPSSLERRVQCDQWERDGQDIYAKLVKEDETGPTQKRWRCDSKESMYPATAFKSSIDERKEHQTKGKDGSSTITGTERSTI